MIQPPFRQQKRLKMMIQHEQQEKASATYLDKAARKALADRMARAEGHLRAIRKMVEDQRCADEILLQISAVKAALNQFSAAILDHELRACMDSCMAGTEEDRLEKVTKVLTTLLKQT